MECLTVQIAEFHIVLVHNAKSSNSCRCKIDSSRTAQPTSPDDENCSLAQLFLSCRKKVMYFFKCAAFLLINL